MSSPCSTLCLRDSASSSTFVVVQCVPEVNSISYSVYEGTGDVENAASQHITGTASSANRPSVGPSFSFLAQKEPYLIVLNLVYASGDTQVLHWSVDPSKRRIKKKVSSDTPESSGEPTPEGEVTTVVKSDDVKTIELGGDDAAGSKAPVKRKRAKVVA